MQKEEEERARTAITNPTASAMHNKEDWDEELEHIEPVVEEPKMVPRTREYRSKKYRRNKQN